MAEFPVTIFHNPNCGTSRNTLAAIRDAGLTPLVVEYLKAGWTSQQLTALFAEMGVAPRDVLRTRGAPPEAVAATDGADDDGVVAAMVRWPILVERPIVKTPKGVRLCRPMDRVAELLP